ncbi:MAG: MBOAT family protein, partial [Flavobacteriales bacterium]|nr:MBOAT family protein [Flavobacteriales bacterium]
MTLLEISWESIKQVVLFDKSSPLIFTNLLFWYFFAFVLLGYSLVHKQTAVRNGFLFLVSIYFYYKTSEWFFYLLLFSTVSDYFIGNAIFKSEVQLHRKLW